MATLLPNGKVLVAGGTNTDANLASAELYDPASGTWTPTGSLGTARQGLTATLLPNGKVLAAGGFDGRGPSASAELYDPALGTWSATGSLRTARDLNHTATLLRNGKVLVAGGGDSGGGPSASAELYDPALGTWSATGSLRTARYDPTATLLPNGKVLVAGGTNTNANLASAELYDPASGTWTPTGSLAAARRLHTATLLPDRKVLVAGGYGNTGLLASAELYDPVSGTWSATGSLGIARELHTATLLLNGNVLIAGGVGDNNVLATAELYDTPVTTRNTLRNISTRGLVQTGDNALIGGFIITGTQPKRVIVRAIGPSLPLLGKLANPTLELFNSGELLATNDDWRSTQEAEILASTVPPGNDVESAIVTTLPANGSSYTAIARGVNDTTGIGMIEVYDLDENVDSSLANISSRGLVGTDENVLIGGFIVGGGGATELIVRALGPSLPVSGTLADPTLELHDGNGALVASNDDWRSTQQAEIIATTIPPTNDSECAIVKTYSPGNYTAIVRGKNNNTGMALVEVYALN